MTNLQDKLDSMGDARRESIISKADELQNQCYEELFQAAWQLLIEIDEFFEDPSGSWIDGIDPGPLAADHLRELLSTKAVPTHKDFSCR